MESQIKTRYDTLITTAQIQNTENTECWQGWVATGTGTHCWSGCKMEQPAALEASLAFLIKTKQSYHMIQQPHSLAFTQMNWNIMYTQKPTRLFIAALFPSYKLPRVSSNLQNPEGKVHSYHIGAIFLERQWNLGLPLLLKYHSALQWVLPIEYKPFHMI